MGIVSTDQRTGGSRHPDAPGSVDRGALRTDAGYQPHGPRRERCTGASPQGPCDGAGLSHGRLGAAAA